MLRLTCQSQHYAWGKVGSASKVAQLCNGDYDKEKPYAELWMGTHKSAPSKCLKTNTPLGEIVALPFLFKVLSINKALSIQAHPDKKLAEKFHAAKPELYKDDNHKPEMAIALTEFEGLCGFKQLSDVSKTLDEFPEFAELVGKETIESFTKCSESNIVDERKTALKGLFSKLMNTAPTRVTELVNKVLSRLGDKSYEKGTSQELFIRLNSQFPGGDVGCFCMLLLNYMRLCPGESFFMPANDPHAYLSGDCIECMATSDNVVRAGLTPKPKDVENLVEMLTYNHGPPCLLEPKIVTKSRLFQPPVDEFAVFDTQLDQNDLVSFDRMAGPSILLVYKGSGEFDDGISTEHVSMGHVYYLPAGSPLTAKADDKEFQFARAFQPK